MIIFFEYHPKLCKEFNSIHKKHCKSLRGDFERLKVALVEDLENNGKFSKHSCNRISGLDSRVSLPAFIVKSFRCKDINKGKKSDFRLTFVFNPEGNYFYFVEMYRKKSQEVENKNRINKLFF